MNLLPATVVKILSEPVFIHKHWWVEVEYHCYGSNSTQKLMFNTKEEAEALEVGHEFLT